MKEINTGWLKGWLESLTKTYSSSTIKTMIHLVKKQLSWRIDVESYEYAKSIFWNSSWMSLKWAMKTCQLKFISFSLDTRRKSNVSKTFSERLMMLAWCIYYGRRVNFIKIVPGSCKKSLAYWIIALNFRSSLSLMPYRIPYSL